MRKSIIASMLLLGGLVATPAAHALDSDWRVKGAMLSLDGDESAATNVGIVYGIDFLGMFGAEFDLNTTLADGEVSVFGTSVDYSATQLGGYATLTTPGPIYFKAKAGLAYNDIEFSNGGNSVSESDSAPSMGVGVGLFGFEIEYTRTEWEDLDVDLLSVSYGF